MKKKYFMMGALFSLILVVLVGITLPTVSEVLAEAVNKNINVSPGVNIYLNDIKLTPKDAAGKPVEVIVYNGTTYLPVRAVADALGVKVNWDGTTQSVYLGEHKVVVQPEQPKQPVEDKQSWVGTYTETYTYGYGTKEKSVDIFDKEYIPYVKLNADGTFNYNTNWFYTMIMLKGTWEIDKNNPNKIILKHNSAIDHEIAFERNSANEIVLKVPKYIQSGKELSTSANGDIYNKK